MKKIVVFLANGFEEVEALTPVDVLRRCGATVVLAGVDSLEITGAHNIKVKCDVLADELKDKLDCVILPGGMPGSTNLAGSWAVNETIVNSYNEGAIIAAICAAPVVVLSHLGLLDGHEATCYPGMENLYPEFKFSEERVVESGNLITAKGAGCAMEFAFVLAKRLFGEDVSKKLADGMIVR